MSLGNGWVSTRLTKFFTVSFLGISLFYQTQIFALTEIDPFLIWNQLSVIPIVHRKQVFPQVFGKVVQVGGYLITNEFNQDGYSEFLLSKFASGCVHVPLPPPTDLIEVHLPKDKLINYLSGKKVVVSGVLARTDSPSSAYKMDAFEVKELLDNAQ